MEPTVGGNDRKARLVLVITVTGYTRKCRLNRLLGRNTAER